MKPNTRLDQRQVTCAQLHRDLTLTAKNVRNVIRSEYQENLEYYLSNNAESNTRLDQRQVTCAQTPKMEIWQLSMLKDKIRDTSKVYSGTSYNLEDKFQIPRMKYKTQPTSSNMHTTLTKIPKN